MDSNFIYYVYAYLRVDGTPYYIGKGTGMRAYDSKHSVNLPPHNRIIFLERNLSNVGALALERRYIRWYGRIDTGTGILRNLTDGGDGVVGRRYKMSEDTKTKISKSKQGIEFTADHRSNLIKNHKGRLGILASQETKKKQSEAALLAPKTTCPHCGKTGKHSGMVRWHLDNCRDRVL